MVPLRPPAYGEISSRPGRRDPGGTGRTAVLTGPAYSVKGCHTQGSRHRTPLDTTRPTGWWKGSQTRGGDRRGRDRTTTTGSESPSTSTTSGRYSVLGQRVVYPTVQPLVGTFRTAPEETCRRDTVHSRNYRDGRETVDRRNRDPTRRPGLGTCLSQDVSRQNSQNNSYVSRPPRDESLRGREGRVSDDEGPRGGDMRRRREGQGSQRPSQP